MGFQRPLTIECKEGSCWFISCAQSECPRGWFHFGKSCYFISHTQKTWVDAASFCRAYHSYLATIETDSENTYLADTITLIRNGNGKGRYWIGGTDEVFEGVWVWVATGKQFSYTNWHTGDLDNWKTGENCLELIVLLELHVPGKWNDADCSLQVQFICEMEFQATGSIIG